MSLTEVLQQDQRRVILDALAEDPNGTHNEHILQAVLSHMGHHASRDVVRGHLAWLTEQGLVRVRGDDVQVAELTQRGLDLAEGRAHVPGVGRKRR